MIVLEVHTLVYMLGELFLNFKLEVCAYISSFEWYNLFDAASFFFFFMVYARHDFRLYHGCFLIVFFHPEYSSFRIVEHGA